MTATAPLAMDLQLRDTVQSHTARPSRHRLPLEVRATNLVVIQSKHEIIIPSQVVRSLILAGRISNTCTRCDKPGCGSALGAYLDPDLVRVTRRELLFFAADVFLPASVFLPLGLLDR